MIQYKFWEKQLHIPSAETSETIYFILKEVKIPIFFNTNNLTFYEIAFRKFYENQWPKKENM